jgi:hypothetical protein
VSSGQCARRAIAKAKHRSQNLLSRGPPCFGRHVKPLVPVAFAIASTHSFQGGLTSGRRPVVKIIAESLSQHDEKHVVPTPLRQG